MIRRIIRKGPRREIFAIRVVAGIGSYLQLGLFALLIEHRTGLRKLTELQARGATVFHRHDEIASITIFHRPYQLTGRQRRLRQGHLGGYIGIWCTTYRDKRDRHGQRIVVNTRGVICMGRQRDVVTGGLTGYHVKRTSFQRTHTGGQRKRILYRVASCNYHSYQVAILVQQRIVGLLDQQEVDLLFDTC